MSLLDNILKKQKWPKEGMKLFSTDRDWWNQASIDYYRQADGLGLIAEGYKTAGDLIINYVKEFRIEQDALVYPMVFLYRHYIELVLKDIISNAKKYFNEKIEYPEKHDLLLLWQNAKKYLLRIPELDNKNDIKAVEKVITEFSIQDPGSYSFRYSEDKKGNEMLSKMSNVNLRQIADVVDALHSYFFGVQSIIAELSSNEYE